jgi:hypothetical protein
VVHVTCAAPVFTDKGKTRLEVPQEAADEFARILWQAGKDLYREQQSAQRASRREDAAAERARKAASRPRMTKKDAVFAVIPEAVRLQRGGTALPFSAHSLFYKIRPLFLQMLPGQTLTASYCEQTLIPAYEREHGPIAGMYREPRGELHKPHDRDGMRAVPLGTREVSARAGRRPEGPEVCVTPNDQLAERLRSRADEVMRQRRVLLVTAVALGESRTVTGARKVLGAWDGPAEVKAAALKLLDQLAGAAGT